MRGFGFLPPGSRQWMLNRLVGSMWRNCAPTCHRSLTEAATCVGRMIVTNYSSKAINLMLPELDRGMFYSIPMLLGALRQPGKGSGTTLQALKV